MRVYVETNFILELVLVQEESAACEALLSLAEAQQILLAVPSFCFVEPYTTLRGRAAAREHLGNQLRRELREIARTSRHADVIRSELPTVLVKSAEEAQQRLYEVTKRLVGLVAVLPLEAPTLQEADRLRQECGLAYPDAIVLACVRLDPRLGDGETCFLNRNTKDFDDPNIVADLGRQRCKVLPGFTRGLAYIRHHLGR